MSTDVDADAESQQQLVESAVEDQPHVGEIRSKGLMAGIELVRDKQTKEPYLWNERIGVRVCQLARKKGLLTRPLGNVIVLIPPLASTDEELSEMVQILSKSIWEVTNQKAVEQL